MDIFGEREFTFQLAFSQLPDGRTKLGGGLNDNSLCKGPYSWFPELVADIVNEQADMAHLDDLCAMARNGTPEAEA